MCAALRLKDGEHLTGQSLQNYKDVYDKMTVALNEECLRKQKLESRTQKERERQTEQAHRFLTDERHNEIEHLYRAFIPKDEYTRDPAELKQIARRYQRDIDNKKALLATPPPPEPMST